MKIMLFAAARELVGKNHVWLIVREPITVLALRTQLGEQFPALKGMLGHCRFAVDRQFATDEDIVAVNQEVALVPPVSGG